MKKKKIVVLFPLLGLLLSGCTFQEGFATAKSWVGSHIYHPAKDFIDGLIGKKDNSSGGDGDVTPTPTPEPDDPSGEGEGGDTPTPTPANPEHKGTKEDPFTGKDACLVGAALEDETSSEDWYYVKGVVQEYNEAFDASYGSYSFAIEEGFKGYRLKNGEGRAKFNENDIEIGDTVVMYGQIKRYRTTYEFDGTNNGKAYVVSVEKPAPEGATLESIKIEGTAQSAYLVGDTYNHSGLTVKAHYDKGEDQDVTSAVEWVFSKEKAEAGDTEITITAKFKGKEASLKVAVTVQSADKPAHAGTLEDPFTGLDAIIIAKTLTETTDPKDRHPSEESYYIKGVVQSLEEAFNSEYGNFTFKIEGGFEGYRLLNGSAKEKFTSADQLQVGDTVTMYAQLLNFKGTYETDGGYIHSIEKPEIEAELVSVKISGEPQTEYLSGAEYNHKGLIATATYDNEEKQEVTSAATWHISKETAEVGDKSITISVDYKDKHDEIVIDVKVVDSSTTEHAGTEEDPYSGTDACIVASKLEAGAATEGSFYIKGVVESFEETFNPEYGNYSFKIDGGFIGWRLKNGSSQAKFNDGDLEIGNTVVMYAQIQAYIKNAGDTPKPETKGGYIVEIVKEAVLVNSVTVSPSVLALEKGKAGAQLSAEVLPENATDKSLIWSSADPEVAAVSSTGLVTAVGEGTTTITATANDGSGKSGSCEVTVTVPEIVVELTEIKISGDLETSEYKEGEDYSPAGLVVTAYYSDESSEEITSSEELEWSMSPATASVGDDEVTFTASYKGEEDSIALPVTVFEAKGTLAHPYTVAEARAAIDAGEGISNVYATGIVSEIVTPYNDGYHNVSFNISADGSKSADQLQGYRTVASSAEDIEVGDTVVLYGTLKKYNSTYEFDAGNTVINNTKATVETVTISGTPSQTTYSEGTAYNHNGLVATAHLDVGLDIDVTELAIWAASKETAEVGDELLSFVATYKEVPSEAFEYAIEVTTEVVPVEQVYKSVAFSSSNAGASITSYTASCEYTDSGFGVTTQNFNNNGKKWESIKCGRKSDASVATITTNAAIDLAVTKVNVTFGAFSQKTGSSAKILVSANADMSNATEYSLTPVSNSTVSVDLGSGAANMYYQVYFDCVAGGSNGYIEVTALSFSAVYIAE